VPQQTQAAEAAVAMPSGSGAFVDGSWLEGAGGEQFAVFEPATGEELARVDACGAAEIEAAVGAARRAFDEDWRWRSMRERAQLLRRVADVVRAHADELAVLECRENGKTRRDAREFDLVSAYETFEFFAGISESLAGDAIPQGPVDAHVRLEPYGVVGAIVPFNWPPVHFAAKCAPSLAVGNTVVLKPGEQAPLTILRLTELVNEVLPPGVLNAVPGIDAGVALSAHPGLGRLTFTGASETGRKVMAGAAQTLTLPTLELGGKNALLVFDDADLDVALPAALQGLFFNKGEACTAASRILVHEDVHDALVERFAAAACRFVVGDGLDPKTDIGPMVDRRQQERVLAYIDLGLAEGARLVAQGEVPDDDRLRDGYWVAPTVLADVRPEMRIAQEEIFGPVACFMRFTDEEQAVEIANGTAYGLTAGVFTGSLERAMRLTHRLDAGMVFVNNYFRGYLGTPHGGVKDSGFGREGAIETLREFTRSKNVRLPSGVRPFPVWESVRRVID
jgi:acyl-CoA reductase-like NAD-dependent aldehyde dehydrogenase